MLHVTMAESQPFVDPGEIRDILMKLLKKAATADEPDHSACGKYLELAFRFMPDTKKGKGSGLDLEAVRRELAEEAEAERRKKAGESVQEP